MRVLYLVNREADTSVPLEVAGHFDKDDVEVLVAAYYSRSDPETDMESEQRVDINLGARGGASLKGGWRLYKLIRRYKPDVIHIHHTLSAFWASTLGRMLRVPVIVKTEHSDHGYYGFAQNVLNFITLSLVDLAICNSAYTQQTLHPWERKVLGKESCVIVHNGVDVGSINASDHSVTKHVLGFQHDDLLLASVGRLVEQKNYENLVEAMKLVIRDESHVRLLIVGDGPLRPTLEKKVYASGLKDHVFFVGEVARETVYEILRVVDGFVIGSVSEGFCNAVVEAMAASKPVVCSDIETFREVVDSAGRFMNPHSPEDMARAILSLVREGPEKRKQWGKTCHKRATEQFAVEQTAAKYIQNYQRVLDAKHVYG